MRPLDHDQVAEARIVFTPIATRLGRPLTDDEIQDAWASAWQAEGRSPTLSAWATAVRNTVGLR